jgi:hypothetical protein
MFNIVIISILIVLIIHYTIDIFTKVEPPAADPRLHKYKSIIENQYSNTNNTVEDINVVEDLEQYVKSLTNI